MADSSLKDGIGAKLAALMKPLLKRFAHSHGAGSKVAAELERQGIAIYPHHYYHPFVTRKDLRVPLSAERSLPGITLDAGRQLAFIAALEGREEIAIAGDDEPDADGFFYNNGAYGYGDADILYAIVRTTKPRMILEIGSGVSTRVVRKAIRKNEERDPAYRCRHVCIEPYEQAWLESFNVELIRQRVEAVDKSLFRQLEAGDILFIDSSHVIRPQGDVLFEYLEILPLLKPGVLVHVHDIFTPFDYPDEWILERKLLWNEQYLLEAFLTFNEKFEILIASNWLATTQNNAYAALLPGFARNTRAQPGNFWMRRVA